LLNARDRTIVSAGDHANTINSFHDEAQAHSTKLVLALLTVSTAQAAGHARRFENHCEQLLQNKVAAPRVLGAWLSGYYNGKRNNTLDTQPVEKNCSKMMNYCRSHLNMAVM